MGKSKTWHDEPGDVPPDPKPFEISDLNAIFDKIDVANAVDKNQAIADYKTASSKFYSVYGAGTTVSQGTTYGQAPASQFVGGPKHGEVEVVKGNAYKINIPVPLKAFGSLAADPFPASEFGFTSKLYRKLIDPYTGASYFVFEPLLKGQPDEGNPTT